MFFGSPRFVDYLPRSSNGTIIITTRDKRVGERLIGRERVIIVNPFSPEDAELLFRSKIPEGDNSSTETVQILLKELGFIPLAITQAAAFISENSMTVAAYIQCLLESDSELQDYLDEDLPDPRRDPSSENSVIRTWKLSFDQIAKQKPRAAKILSLIAVLDRQAIPKSLFCEKDTQSIEFNKAMGTLQAFSLVTVEKDKSTFEVHRLIHLSTQKWLAFKRTLEEWQRTALKLMAKKFPIRELKTWKACELLLPHALVALRYLPEAKDMALRRAELLHAVGKYDKYQGRYNVAYLRFKEVFQVREKLLGKEHPNTLGSMNSLALVLQNQGEYKEAEQIHRQTLKLRERLLGKEHPDTLVSINNLALVLQYQGNYEEAEQMHRQTLSLTEAVLGKEHPVTLISMSNLAAVLQHQGKYEEAEKIFRQVISQREKVLGKEHPNTLGSINNIATVLGDQGKYEEAEKIFRQVLSQREVSGKEHPDTLGSMNNLAVVLRKQGKYEEAEKIFRQVLSLRGKVLAKEHLDTLSSMKDLELLLKKKGENAEGGPDL